MSLQGTMLAVRKVEGDNVPIVSKESQALLIDHHDLIG